MARVAVVGAGAMGLATAYYAIKAGHTVEVFEAAPEPGGMAAHLILTGSQLSDFIILSARPICQPLCC